MPFLKIHLLGDFLILADDELVTSVDKPRLQFLLAYLVLHQDAPQSRQHLSFLFWPDSLEAQARTNLRNVLHQLRQTLPGSDRFLAIESQTLQWRPDTSFTLDVFNFEQLMTKAEQLIEDHDSATARQTLEEAVALYQGDLLPSCYEEWIQPERERLRQKYMGALEQLIQLLEQQRDYPIAIRYAQHLLRYDPLHEATYRRLMRLFALNNDLARALRIYHDCEQTLQRELGVEPSPETQSVYQNLLKRDTPDAPSTVSPTRLVVGWPLVGRQEEWKLLMAAWHTATRGRAQMVVITGEAGMGKTRLAEELLQWASQQGITATRAHLSAVVGRLAYEPVSDWLRSPVFQTVLPRLDNIWLTEVARILPELLVEHPNLPAPEPLTTSWQRKRLFEALVRVVLAGDRPLLLLIDDLQWCDQETLEWLHYLLSFESTTQLLLVGTVRTEEVEADHPLTPFLLNLRRSRLVTEIELASLDETETASLATHVADKHLDASVVAHLYRETEGNPLFVVEIVRADLPLALETQVSSRARALSLPPLIQAVIETRLSHLSPPARELVHLAATIGREFTFEVLVNASDSDEDTLAQSLDELWQRRLIREQGSAYDFSHEKIREVAYAGVSTPRRRLLHRRVAQALENAHAPNLDIISAQLAVHYEQANLLDKAIIFYRQAAEVAQQIYAHREAAYLLTQGLALLRTIPGLEQHSQQELDLLTTLSPVLVIIKGYASPEVEKCFSRMIELCKTLGRTSQLFDAQQGLWVSYLVRLRLREALDLAEHLQSKALHIRDTYYHLISHTVLGMTYFHLGQQVVARKHLEKAIALVRSSQQNTSSAPFFGSLGVHIEVDLLSYNQHVVWLLGDVNQALQISKEALSLAQQTNYPYSQDFALAFAAVLHLFRREVKLAKEQVQKAIELSEIYEFLQWKGHETILKGRTLVEEGKIKEGIDLIGRGLEIWWDMGARVAEPYYLSLLAEAHSQAGEINKGLIVLAKAIAHVETYGDHWWEAELYRLRGELLLSQNNLAAAEADFKEAITIAEGQNTKSLELRATVSLARLWQSQGKTIEAYQVLTKIYGWFTEGFDTIDLQEASALLEELLTQL